jgi:hypothetical protein
VREWRYCDHMMARKFLPRMSQADVEALMRAHTFAVQADSLLQQTNWAGGEPCRILVGNIDVVICGLVNKVERALMAGAGPESTAAPQEASQEPYSLVDIGRGGKSSPNDPGASGR